MDYGKFAFVYIQREPDDPLPGKVRDAGFGYVEAISPSDSPRQAFVCALAENSGYVVTADAKDGFSLPDILAVANALSADDSALYAGARKSAEKGNAWTALFVFLAGLGISDSTTSLLGMSAALCATMVNMKSSDKAFMMNILLEARSQSVTIKEVPTAAVCAEHPGFELMGRSFKLYFVFIKFSISATIAYIVDIGAFYLFEQAFISLADSSKVLLSTVFSRILCSIVTYLLNKGAVFKSQAKQTGAVVRFIIMSVVQLLASWLLVWGIGSLLGGSNVTNMLLKIVVDLVIFLVSFPIQRDWVFKKTDKLLG